MSSARSEHSLSVCLPHCSWIPERRKSLARIQAALHLGPPATWPASLVSPDPGKRPAGFVSYAQFADREPRWEWSRKLWGWCVEQPVTHCLVIADDTMLGPHALATVLAMIEAVPDRAIGLTSQHPTAPKLFHDGTRWYKAASPWLVGWAYLLPRPMLAAFLEWRDVQSRQLLEGDVGADDQLINAFLASKGTTTWHPTLTPFDHDLALDSAMGHPIETKGRREPSTKVPWHIHPWRGTAEPCDPPPWCKPEWWSVVGDPPVLSVPPSEESWREWESAR